MKYAIRAGIGIGLIPDYLTGEETELVPVLQDAELPTMPVYFVYPEELKTRQESAGLPGFPGHQGAAVEVLRSSAVASHAIAHGKHAAALFPTPGRARLYARQL